MGLVGKCSCVCGVFFLFLFRLDLFWNLVFWQRSGRNSWRVCVSPTGVVCQSAEQPTAAFDPLLILQQEFPRPPLTTLDRVL